MTSKTLAEKPTILFAPHMDTSLLEMLDIALVLEEQGKYRPLVFVHWEDHQQALEICEKHGIEVLLYRAPGQGASRFRTELPPISSRADGENEARAFGSRTQGFRSVLAWGISTTKRFLLPQLLLYLGRFYRIQIEAKSILGELQPACLLFMSDRHVGIETALIEAANKAGIPSLIVPFALSESSGLAEYRLAQPGWQKVYGISGWINRYLARTRPSWSYVFEGNTLLWNTASWMIAAEIMGMMPANPWALGGGKAWMMAVESEYNKINFEEQGTPSSKMVVTGKPRYDRAAVIWKNQPVMRSEICDALGLDAGKPLLVCAVPQLAEHDFLPWPEHWREIEFLFENFSRLQPEINTVLSLHPKSDFAEYSPRADKYNLVIAREHGYDQLIPVCDVFVATHSSTVTLAVAAHKPTIIVDFYGLDYYLFKDVPGIEIVRQHEKFPPLLARIFNDRTYYNRLVAGQAQAAQKFALFDSKATERILDLIVELVKQGKAIRQLAKHERRKALPPWAR